MKTLLFLVLLAIAGCAFADSKTPKPIPPGAYAVRMDNGNVDSQMAIDLTCYTDSVCTMRTVIRSPGIEPMNEVRRLEKIVRLEQIPQTAVGALRYAVENRDRPVTLRDSAYFMSVSKAMLSDAPEITGCWDLNDPTPSYTLACTVRTTSNRSGQLVIFVEMVMDCRDGFGFCEYATMPLTRSTAPGHFEPPLRAQWQGAETSPDGSFPIYVDDDRGNRLTVSCVFGEPQTCTWTLTVTAACPRSNPITGLITSPAGKFPVRATCTPALSNARAVRFKLDDSQDVDRSILQDGIWEIALATTAGLKPMRFNTTGAVRVVQKISGCHHWGPRCERNLPAEFRALAQ